jgi:Glycoside hydrolase family 44
MKRASSVRILGLVAPAALAIVGCGGGGGSTPPPPTTYTLTVNSTGASAVAVLVSPADTNSSGNGTTNFTRTYDSGASVTLTAPSTSGKSTFTSWTGCTSTSTVTCKVTMSGSATVSAAYATAGVTSVTVTPGPTSTATIGTTIPFSASVAGTGSYNSTVTWSVLGPPGSALSAGSIDSNGNYETPYPAPATVTVTATSTDNTAISGSSVVTLNPPPTPGTALALTVDAGNITRPINPFIYGWDSFAGASDNSALETEEEFIDLPVNRWGGDATTRYNYLTDTLNSASDFWYQNEQNTPSFDNQVAVNNATNTVTLGTVPLIGWTSLNNGNCGYSVTKYGAQAAYNPYNSNCGNGLATDGVTEIINDPTDTSEQIDVTFTTGWMQYLVGKWGTAASGGVAIYDLDNEPTWWDAVHKDVHGSQIKTTQSVPYKGPFTYDEVTTKGLQYAAAIKAVDPTAAVSGPVIDFWPAYFYSKLDIETGWGTSPCFCYNGNPVDRMAHGNVPFIEYYLQQFAANDAKTGFRSLDYVDIHGYFAADNAGFATAGDTALQQARLNSTRALWDPTYTDPNYTDPNVAANAPPIAPQLIPMLHKWVAADYPGTKTAIDEYNWGGQEHINGALAQADILGIFGREGLDLAALWGPPDPTTQVPGLMAYAVYRNYDGNHSKFGDMALNSVSADQSQLAIYGALRSSDNAVTIVVINKTYGALPATISLPNLTANGAAKSFLYSNANLAAIVAQPDVTVTAAKGTAAASITQTFPAASITVLVIPMK